jgi:hypothetical protein
MIYWYIVYLVDYIIPSTQLISFVFSEYLQDFPRGGLGSYNILGVLKFGYNYSETGLFSLRKKIYGMSDILAVSVWVLSKGQGWRFGL